MERVTLEGDGVAIAADAAGPADGPPILFLPGGGQTRQSWGASVAEAARRGYRAIAADQRGHGDSGWAADGDYGVAAFVRDARRIIAQLDRPPAIVGASLGGLVGLSIAGSPPPAIGALVLVDITPRIETEGREEILAFMGSAPDGFASPEEAADAVSAYLPHRPRPRDTSGLLRNLRLRDGRYHWHWDPAFLQLGDEARDAGGTPELLTEAARQITVPTLLVRGGRSRLVSEEAVAEFRALVPHADYVDIAGAHHMVAGDANDVFATTTLDFLDRHYRRQPVDGVEA
jgi:pimeloyl-ACP methyl ester carboxylesterase